MKYHLKQSAFKGLIAACGLAITMSFSSMAVAEDTPHFAGKTINIAIRSTPGGGYDSHARLLARHMGRHIPGNPNIITVNRPGAGGIVAANYVYQQGAADGTDIVIAAREIALAEALGQSGVQYKTMEMPVLGSPVQDNRVWLAGPNTVARNLEELKNLDRDFLFAVSGLGAGSAQMVQLLEVSGFPVRMITGYEGTGDQLLALLRGEVDGMNSTYPAQRELIREENLTIVAKLGNHPELAEYDDVREFLEGDQRALANILAGPLVAGRPFFVAPGTPDHVVQILRDAFAATMEDPAYIEELARMDEEVNFATPEEMEEIFRETLNAPASVLDLFRGD